MKKPSLAAARRLFDGQVIVMLVCAVLFTLSKAVAAGTRLAALTIQSDEACCPSLPDFWEEMTP